MNDETLITDLIQAGLSAELVGRVVNAVLSVTVRGQSADIVDSRRDRDRLRKQKKRELTKLSSLSPKANDVGETTKKSADMSAENAETSSTLLTSFLPIQDGIREVKKEPKSRSVALAKKGTRLSSAATLSNEDREFAFELGFDDSSTMKMWAEFVDYWSALPGHRGLKLSWTSTWRNRVREMADRRGNGKRSHSGGAGRPGGDFLAGIAKVAASLAGDGPVAGPADPEIPLGRVNIDGQRARNG